jgi:hypothetical protein
LNALKIVKRNDINCFRIRTNHENALSRTPIYLDSDNSNDSFQNVKQKRKVGEKSLRNNSCSEDGPNLKLGESSPVKKKTKQSGKLAPIFTMGKKNCSTVTEDPEKVAARLAFLHSSVPESLRNQV